ncbi:MAG: hypothetical protein MRY74_00300 [Neomegalonema sp.]|nr:hypothetical protein [Neomegalonema sp.]
MSYAVVAAGAEAYAGGLRRAESDSRTLRAVEALGRLARALGALKDQSDIERSIATAVAADARGDRLGGVCFHDLIEPIEVIAAIARAAHARKSAIAPFEQLAGFAETFSAADVAAIATALEAELAAQRAAAEAEEATKRAKEHQERAVGASFANRLGAAPQNRAGLAPIFAEMKVAKPKLPAAAWKEAADIWVRRDESRSAKAARQAIESKIAAIVSAARAEQGGEQTLAMRA